jgi:hypothetical protein
MPQSVQLLRYVQHADPAPRPKTNKEMPGGNGGKLAFHVSSGDTVGAKHNKSASRQRSLLAREKALFRCGKLTDLPRRALIDGVTDRGVHR